MRLILNFLSLAWCIYIVGTGYSYALDITVEWQQGFRDNTVLFGAWFVVFFFGLLAIGNFLSLYSSLKVKKNKKWVKYEN